MSRISTSFVASSLFTALLLGGACSAPEGSATASGDGDGNITVGDGDGVIDPGDGTAPAPPGCGDGSLDEDEACDDGGREDGDGCSANCLQVESGFICRAEGVACERFAKCGDGVADFPEQCDDGGLVPDDGCSATCKIEIGWKCEGDSCSTTTCGDGVREGAELCDDGNAFPFDGCSVDCQIEPACSAGEGCTSTCGDGIVIGGETCDDGNTTDNDGCSSSCQTEPGYTCIGEPCEMQDGACVLRVPMILRDFPVSHPDFGLYQAQPEAPGGQDKGMVAAQLDTEGKPVPASTGSVTGLADWYRDGAGGNSGPILQNITLFQDAEENFVNRFKEDGTRWAVPLGAPSCQQGDNGGDPCPVDGNPLFFPLDGIANPAGPNVYDAEVPQPLYGGFSLANNVFPGHNFHFTTEVTYWFAFDPAANAQLTFVGDDDVWVFINGILAVDIGNKHEPRGGRITLGADMATVGYSTDQAFQNWSETTRPISDFGLAPDGVYEIKVFHAERSTRSSSFQLTLGGFDTSKSDCAARCGDGILGVGEECDDGVNDGGYNECQPDCVLGGYCGDGVVQEGEICDDAAPDAPSTCRGCRLIVVR